MLEVSDVVAARLEGTGKPVFLVNAPDEAVMPYIVFKVDNVPVNRTDAFPELVEVEIDVYARDDPALAGAVMEQIHALLVGGGWRVWTANGRSTYFRRELAQPLPDPDDLSVTRWNARYSAVWNSVTVGEQMGG